MHHDPLLARQLQPELGEHGARLPHGARSVGAGLVPGGRHAQQRGGVAGAQRAHDHVVSRGSVLHNHQLEEGIQCIYIFNRINNENDYRKNIPYKHTIGHIDLERHSLKLQNNKQ